jgi:hypothetical protein
MSFAFGAMMTIESENLQIQLPSEPKKAVQHVTGQGHEASVDTEMRPLPFTNFSSGSGDDTGTADESRRVSRDENRETQRPGAVSDQVQTIWHPYMNRFRVMAACLTSLANGMNDSAPGALIASLERYEWPEMLPRAQLIISSEITTSPTELFQSFSFAMLLDL